MKLISHRGNINGRQANHENMPEYVNSAIQLGYDVEVDVWYDNGFWLGHDNPQYKIDILFLINSKLWCHAKNGEALYEMRKYDNIHSFWHQSDDFVLTSQGFIWTYPKKQLYLNSICVLPELGYQGDISQCYGICSDFISRYLNER